MTPQTIYILVYKNAIASGLRIIQKLPIQNIEQFDDMIKYNDNPINNNFGICLHNGSPNWHKCIKNQISQWQNGNSILTNYNTD